MKRPSILALAAVLAILTAAKAVPAATVLVDEVHGQPCLDQLQTLLPDHTVTALTIGDLPIDVVLAAGTIAVTDTVITFTVPAGAEMLYGRFDYPIIFEPPYLALHGPGGVFVDDHCRGSFHVEAPSPGDYTLAYSFFDPLPVSFEVGTGPEFFTPEVLAAHDVLFRLRDDTYFLFIGWLPEYSPTERARLEARVQAGGGCLMVRNPLLDIALKPIVDLTAPAGLTCDLAVDLPGRVTYAAPAGRTEAGAGTTRLSWDGVAVRPGETTRLVYEGALSPSRPWLEAVTDGPEPRLRNLSDETLHEVVLVRREQPGQWAVAAAGDLAPRGEGPARVAAGLTREAARARLAATLHAGGLAGGLGEATTREFLDHYRWADRFLDDTARGDGWTAVFRVGSAACDRYLPLWTNPGAGTRARTLWFWVAGIPRNLPAVAALPPLDLEAPSSGWGAGPSSLAVREYGVVRQTYPAPRERATRDQFWFDWWFYEETALVDPTDNCGTPECPYFTVPGGHPDAAEMLAGLTRVEGWYSGAVDAPADEVVLRGDDDAMTEDGMFPPGSYPPVAVAKSFGEGRVAAIHDSKLLDSGWPDDAQFLRNVVDWVAGPTTGVEDSEVPASARLVAVQPNPFNPRTEIEFALDGAQRITLAVFDAAGRRVAVLVDEIRPAGRHRTVWQGRDDAGRELPSGVYLVRLSGETRTTSAKIVLVR